MFANTLIRAASAFASSDGSGRSRGFSGGEPGADVGGVVAEEDERPETEEELMVVKVWIVQSGYHASSQTPTSWIQNVDFTSPAAIHKTLRKSTWVFTAYD